MAIIKEFRCAGHGPFEAEEPICPQGCTARITRDFRTPVGISTSGRTRGIDKTLEGIAAQYGLSDMNNHGGTTAARIPVPGGNKHAAAMEAIRRKYPTPWAALPSAKQGGAVAAVAAHGASEPINVREMAQTFPKRSVERVTSHSDAEITAKAMKAA